MPNTAVEIKVVLRRERDGRERREKKKTGAPRRDSLPYVIGISVGVKGEDP